MDVFCSAANSEKNTENNGLRHIYYKKSIEFSVFSHFIGVCKANVANLMTSQSPFFFEKKTFRRKWALVPTYGALM